MQEGSGIFNLSDAIDAIINVKESKATGVDYFSFAMAKSIGERDKIAIAMCNML